MFFKIESWNFQHLLKKKKIITWTTNRKNENKNCLNELKFFKQMLKISAFYLEKQKKRFIPKKNWAKPRVNWLQYQNNHLFTDQIFSDGFGAYYYFPNSLNQVPWLNPSILPILWLFVFLVLCFFNFMCFGKFPKTCEKKVIFKQLLISEVLRRS